jgi:hypothetical protein
MPGTNGSTPAHTPERKPQGPKAQEGPRKEWKRPEKPEWTEPERQEPPPGENESNDKKLSG